MTKYIKCNEDFINRAMHACGPCTTAVIGVTELLEQEVAADVAEIKHGAWKLHRDGSGTCNQCGFIQKNVWDYDNWQNYCGVCGAKMDKKEGAG